MMEQCKENETMKNYKIAVAGTGYVGLSIATLLSQHHQVTAVDIVPEKVELINNRKSPIQDDYIEKYLAEKELNLTATLDAKTAYTDADFVVITAPTNYDSHTQHFDTSAVEAVIKLVMKSVANRCGEDVMEKILIVGPSSTKSKGGMSTVIGEILEDNELKNKYDISAYESYIDGTKFRVLLYSIWAIFKFIVTGQAKKYDVYHIHAASYGSTFRKRIYLKIIKKYKKKVILHIHGAEYMVFFDKLSKKKKRQVIDTLQVADMVIALSNEWKNKFDNKFGLTNCYVLENGINTEKLAPAIVDTKKNQTSFVTLGRLGKRKGTYDLVDAIEIARKKVPNIRCYLAGDGEIDKFCNIIVERGLQNNIEVVGWADFTKKLELLSKVSTVVLPSYNEGLPMSILEGMATGKAIISTTVGAIPEVVKEENGILIQPGDVQALADALVKCSTNLKMLEDMSQKNINKIYEQFSMKSMHLKLMSYYKQVIKNG